MSWRTRTRSQQLSYYTQVEQRDLDDTLPGGPDAVCSLCAPFDCDHPDTHLGVPSRFTPLLNRGCRCQADYTGSDCMCFEFEHEG